MDESSADATALEKVEEAHASVESRWYLYLIETVSGALYTGITTDVERRFAEHQNGKRGARALRGKGPLHLVHHQPVGSRSEALRLEAWLKKLSATAKRGWLETQWENQSNR